MRINPSASVQLLSQGSLTFDGAGHKVRARFGLLHAVPLHDDAILVEAQEPGPARLVLPVQCGRVDHVVVLKHRLLELTLCCEHILTHTHTHSQSVECEINVVHFVLREVNTSQHHQSDKVSRDSEEGRTWFY